MAKEEKLVVMNNLYLGVHLQTPNKVKNVWTKEKLDLALPKINELMALEMTNKARATALGVSYSWFMIALRQLNIPVWRNTKKTACTWREGTPSSINRRQAEFKKLTAQLKKGKPC